MTLSTVLQMSSFEAYRDKRGRGIVGAVVDPRPKSLIDVISSFILKYMMNHGVHPRTKARVIRFTPVTEKKD
jgi:hypothetical protein